MLEKMGAFFDTRLDGYNERMLNNIESAREFHPFTARCLPQEPNVRILDLGCATGLELEEYFRMNPSAQVTGIDLAPGMLQALGGKFADNDITLICGSYFNVPFGEGFDAAVSVESLHHFTREEKIPLYRKLRNALTAGGYFILTDYFSLADWEEQLHRAELRRLKQEQGITDNEFYYYDMPLTVEHEIEALLAAGFTAVEVLGSWEPTITLRSRK